MYKYSAILVLFLSGHLSFFFSVSFQKLVDQVQFTNTFDRVQRWERVAFILQHSHGCSVQILSVRKTSHVCVSCRLILKPYRQHFKKFGNQIFFCEPEISHFHCFFISISLFSIINQLKKEIINIKQIFIFNIL